MKVTRITKQAKRNDRYSVYVDDKYTFSLSDYQLVSSGIVIGKEYTVKQIQKFATESQFGKMYERSLNYVMIRPRSEKETKDYLVRSFLYPKPKRYQAKDGQYHTKTQVVDKSLVTRLINRVIDRLQEKGYINDFSFAKAWVNSRQLTKKSSLRKLRQELLQKGVAETVINETLETEADSELQNLRSQITKKRRLSRYQDDSKLIQYLLRQGFNYDDIKSEIYEK